ncbi:Kiwa anti-phage protein KwaB-like domain-containing protein [Aeromonas veronii]|uniref:Kiwa anti-phage protein KwaB-like domain-containing protein n=1 Tax=Aeromonas veronii TaxID=654 RepID=UPI0022450F54|nr:Kiwa anti-phage protein KwaB-like domain-containing protein [Aeromonas veronii]MCX0438731.1 DUF4868 domain-containing protein [Aeromonas veronii]
MSAQTKIQNILEILDDSNISVNLYFISRHVKEGIAKTARVVDKFSFRTNSVDISPDLVTFFTEIAKKQLNKPLKTEGYELEGYTVISDDLTNKLYTYALNNALSFSDVIENQLPSGNIKTISSLKEISKDLWAYCLKVEANGQFAYIFRKISSSKVATDEPRNKLEKLSSYFDTSASELKVVIQETISFDDKLDCIYDGTEFLIFRKSGFEHIVGLEQEFTENANHVISIIKEANLVDGIEHVEEEIKKNRSLLKSLSNIKRKGTHDSFNSSELAKMSSVYKQFNGKDLKINDDGKLIIENTKDVSDFIKLLNDYYKQGMVTGKFYGTNSGSVIEIA